MLETKRYGQILDDLWTLMNGTDQVAPSTSCYAKDPVDAHLYAIQQMDQGYLAPTTYLLLSVQDSEPALPVLGLMAQLVQMLDVATPVLVRDTQDNQWYSITGVTYESVADAVVFEIDFLPSNLQHFAMKDKT